VQVQSRWWSGCKKKCDLCLGTNIKAHRGADAARTRQTKRHRETEAQTYRVKKADGSGVAYRNQKASVVLFSETGELGAG